MAQARGSGAFLLLVQSDALDAQGGLGVAAELRAPDGRAGLAGHFSRVAVPKVGKAGGQDSGGCTMQRSRTSGWLKRQIGRTRPEQPQRRAGAALGGIRWALGRALADIDAVLSVQRPLYKALATTQRAHHHHLAVAHAALLRRQPHNLHTPHHPPAVSFRATACSRARPSLSAGVDVDKLRDDALAMDDDDNALA
jgi:hypothetical protein